MLNHLSYTLWFSLDEKANYNSEYQSNITELVMEAVFCH